MAQAFSALIALVTAFVAAPLIAWYTKGKYYLARRRNEEARSSRACSTARSASATTNPTTWRIARLPRPHLLAVLLARRTLQRHVQAAGELVGAVAGGCARAAARALVARLDTELGRYLLLMAAACRCWACCST
jgi:hypothetical protein